jgi:hypothetical protein
MSQNPSSCDCCSSAELSRRGFLKSTLTGLAAAGCGGVSVLASDSPVLANSSSETLVTTLFKSLTDEQRRNVVFPFDHPLRSKVDNNWYITNRRLGKDFTPDQQAMVREIFLKMHSPDYAQRVFQQVEHDAGADGFGACSIALFGEPGTGQFEFVLSGRHVTRRCDGNSAGQSSTAMRLSVMMKRQTTRRTFTGTRPNVPTRSSKCSMANSGRSRC